MEILLADRPELRKVIYEKYPLTKEERKGCMREKTKNDGLRLEFAKELIQNPSKKEYY